MFPERYAQTWLKVWQCKNGFQQLFTNFAQQRLQYGQVTQTHAFQVLSSNDSAAALEHWDLLPGSEQKRW